MADTRPAGTPARRVRLTVLAALMFVSAALGVLGNTRPAMASLDPRPSTRLSLRFAAVRQEMRHALRLMRRDRRFTFKELSMPFEAAAAKRQIRPKVRLPDEAAGINGIVKALISVYDQFDVIALGEMHDRRQDSDLRIALVRHPGFAKKVRTIVVEWGSTTEQATLDRYIRGENVSRAQFEQVWKKLSPGNIGDLVSEHSIYTDFFAAVREVNSRLPPAERIRVFGGDAGPTARDTGAVSILKEQALRKRGKALVIYGHAHFWRAVPGLGGISRTLDIDYRGRTFVVIPVGGQTDVRPEDNVAKPDYQKFDRALKTQARPVMVPLQRLPFRDLTAEDFLKGDVVRRSHGRWVSIFDGSTLTLGQMADALVYFGRL